MYLFACLFIYYFAELQEIIILDERVVILFPAAIYAICVGVSIIKDHCGWFTFFCNIEDKGKASHWLKAYYVSLHLQK